MRRVLVPLDGSPFAEWIIRDARRMAGANGTLILTRDASRPSYSRELGVASGPVTFAESEEYLQTMARLLREQGVTVEAHTTFLNDISLAIDAAAELFKADMIACSTHGRSVLGRLVRGGAAWQALAGSNVPVLLRHGEDRPDEKVEAPQRRCILVPLDGSEYSEQALPLAQQLARERNARILLVRVVTGAHGLIPPFALMDAYALEFETEIANSQAYLEALADALTGDVDTQTYVGGSIVNKLIGVVEAKAITDVVMASHGRTGLSRVIVGSVADSLIHKLHLPVIVIPALAVAARGVHSERPITDGVPVHV